MSRDITKGPMGLLYVLHSRAATSLPCAPNLTAHPQLGYYSQEVNETPEPAIAQKMREHWERWGSLAFVRRET